MPPSPQSEDHQDSGSDDNADQSNKPQAVKDKECPYCHQHFTSSSLGRHLDQFISKKKADGKHNVDEIRKLRGGITRRTARGSKKDNDDTSDISPTPINGVIEKVKSIIPERIDTRINRLNWQATGVITDPADLDNRTSTLIASPPAKKRSFSTYTQDLDPNSSETTRALELSLREVLDSLKAANKELSPKPSPFNFDIYSHNFPSLCLAILPTPPTLFQTTPLQTANSISLSPPGLEQLNALRQSLKSKVEVWKWDSLRLAQRTTSNMGEEAEFLGSSAKQYSETALAHLDATYQSWMTNKAETRTQLWIIEILRAFKTEQDKTKAVEEELEQVQQEANQLQQQVDYLSKCQWPREMAMFPPKRKTYKKSMKEELSLIKLTKDQWDFDELVNKWKTRIKEDKIRRLPHADATESNPTIPMNDHQDRRISRQLQNVTIISD